MSPITWRVRAARRTAETFRWSRQFGPARTRVVEVRSDRVPVLMCCWKRLHRLEKTIELLAEQTAPVALHLWANRADPSLERIVQAAPIPVSLTVSSRNVGSFGRFYLARDLTQHGAHHPVIVIDDDQEFAPNMVELMLADYQPKTISAWWAFRFDDQLERLRVEPGEPADQIGPGGMVCDADLFHDPGFWACPRRYWFADDIWISYYAGSLGWSIRRGRAEFEMFNDEHDLFRTLGSTKQQMIRKLWAYRWSAPASAVAANESPS